MQTLHLKSTNDTPSIILDKENNIFKISGLSLPEDAIRFYEPVVQAIAEYVKDPNDETEFVFDLEYFNSASVKEIIEILCELEKIIPTRKKVKVIWHYSKEDDLMEAKAKEFMTVVAVPFDMIAH